ncbi:2-oxoglutarate dehydrogenase complex dihydrolipoyllysine-residue succinyltransferase [Limnoglobus roseus]|uniref:Dihydrolipoyllysine-residue succinyltransferase component of 2-oxoglutarate dehydrogenase complex n=1 Tax=Limnoglobus roseus TaxID=2598579 RepID=A0A5C1ALF2_9BACT|nr:2-oxoglutarate dehydrogenase complex dihydrolipoyllysine-residue succinyltransferase [Limnoglobus roseus]QEL18983.1 dihydrolipoyllysine-residue succinyltransferase [Limnoglobus roseus]
MAIEITVPSAGESVTEARIARWMKKSGEAVKVDEPILELETDKASLEIAAPAAGVLTVTVEAGQIVKIGQVIGSVDPSGKATVAPAQATVEKKADPKGEAKADVKLSPAARAMVADSGLDAAKVSASGPAGLVTKDDVLKHQSAPAPAANGTAKPEPTRPAKSDGPRETRQPMSMIRRRIAERLLESQNTTATLTTFNEVDLSAAMDLRAKYNEKFEKKHGVKLGFMSIFAKASVVALKAFPLVNARLDGGDVVLQNFYDIGMAVSTEKGLMVPVVRNVDAMGFAEIEKEIGAVAKRARDGKITPADMTGGTFTITNGGIFGSMLSTPILNPPQAAILGMHSIQKRAVVVNDEIVIRPMMYLALSYDHRLIDGREAVQFLVRIKECVESPERMLFDI